MVSDEWVPVIAFIAAESREFSGLRRRVEGLRRVRSGIQYSARGELRGHPVILAANGPGARLAGEATDAATTLGEDVQSLVSTGFCGAVRAGLGPNQIFVATSVNGQPSGAPRKCGQFAQGPLLSQDRVAISVQEKRELAGRGAAATEMEAAAVLARAQARDIPFFCVRAVTDTAEEGFGIDFNRMRGSSGRFSRVRIVVAALRKPFTLLPELVQLDKRCRGASEALGDFLANCEF